MSATHPFSSRISVPSKPRRLPVWPEFSIVLLIVLAVIFPPGFLTGMSFCLLFLAGIAWLASGEKFDRNLLRAVGPFILIVLIGLLGGIGADLYLYLKDAWYVSNPAFLICVGYVFYRNTPDLARGLRAFVIGGTLLALLHFVVLARNPEVFNLSAYKLRAAVGSGYYAIALAFTILCAYFGRWREGLRLPNWVAIVLLVICAAGVGASFSRTMVIMAGIGAMSAAGFFARRELRRMIGLIVIVLAAMLALNATLDLNSDEARESFLGKIAKSVEELTVDEYSDLRSINLNWRGYETSRAMRFYVSGSPVQLLTGQGFGAQVDLGLFMPLSTSSGRIERIRLVPILHNGYAYLLVKGGPISVALFAYAIVWLYLVGRRNAANPGKDANHAASRVMQGVAVGLAFATFFISGVFNRLDMFPYMLAAGFLLGALCARRSGAQ